MQLKKIISFLFLCFPIALFGQNHNDKDVSTEERPLALLEKGRKHNLNIEEQKRKELTDSFEAATNRLAVSSATLKKIDEDLIKSSLNRPVPLIGLLSYYGEENNAYLIKYTTSYMNNFQKRFINLERKEKELQTIESILAKHAIPKELEYLAVIESALNANARSPVGAYGYWQFMSFTARQMGLTVNKQRDDRSNLYKSTTAAAKYLNYLYKKFDDWLLVVAAYNCGDGKLERSLQKVNGEKNFWTVKKYLPRETQNHVLAFIATATIMERLNEHISDGLPEDFDWTSLNYKSSAEIRSEKIADRIAQEERANAHPLVKRFGKAEVEKMAVIKISKPISLQVLASVLQFDPHKINRWNYDYRDFEKNYKDGDTYNLRIPKEKFDLYLSQRNYIQKASYKMPKG